MTTIEVGKILPTPVKLGAPDLMLSLGYGRNTRLIALRRILRGAIRIVKLLA